MNWDKSKSVQGGVFDLKKSVKEHFQESEVLYNLLEPVKCIDTLRKKREVFNCNVL